jgi:hypothetical protein
LIERVRAELADREHAPASSRASADSPGPSWPNSRTQRRGSGVGVDRHAAGQVVDPEDGEVLAPRPRGEAGEPRVVAHVLVAVGDHRAAAVPAPAADDVDLGGQEGVGVAHDGADVEVVLPVLDGDVEGWRRASRSATIASRRQ